MKRSTARWTTAVAAAAIFSLPVGSQAQTATQPPAAQTAQPDQQESSPQVHIRKAEDALNEIDGSAIQGRAKSRINELKQQLSKLERANAGSQTWQKDVAAADKILSELIAQDPAGAPAPTGTSGSTASQPSSKPAASAQLDESARAKLTEVRSHLTAFAAAMAGAPNEAAAEAAPSASASAASSAPTSGTPGAAGTGGTAGTEGTAGMSGTAGATGTSGTASSAAAQPPSQPTPPTDPQSPTAGAQPEASQADADAAKKHLTDARNALSAMTQLPAASQLTGDARTQVSELISNFNALITTTVDWPAAYAKVEGNLNSLIGQPAADEPARTGTTGAVGTSGTATIDPEIRAKLMEFRSHLELFEKAAGGAAADSPDPAAAAADAPSPSTTSAATPSPSGATMTPTPSSPSAPAPSSTGTAATGTAAEQTGGQTAGAGTATQAGAISRDEAMQHVQAIESLLSGQASASGTEGAAGTSGAASVTLDAAKVQQLRTHLAELKRILGQK